MIVAAPALPNLSALSTHEVAATGNSLDWRAALIVEIEYTKRDYGYQLTIVQGELKFNSKYFKPDLDRVLKGYDVTGTYRAPTAGMRSMYYAMKLLNAYKGAALNDYEFIRHPDKNNIIVLKKLQ